MEARGAAALLHDLPDTIAGACAPVFSTFPLDAAMPALLPGEPAAAPVAAVQAALRDPALAGRPALHAGLWLYVDALDASHTISQGLPDGTGAFWHGIMHRREGDFANAQYWFQRAGRHPAMAALPDHDPLAFVAAVAAQEGANPPELLATQRAEWAALFAWCARQ